jgi:hypothetical protein
MNNAKDTDRYTSGYNETKIHYYTAVSLIEGEGLPNL